MSGYRLAQINIARALAPLDSKQMQGFVDRLDEINTLADRAEGFVWRLITDADDADDPLDMIINMSLWSDVESLKAFVYKSMHVELIRNREDWFQKMIEAHQALWWVPAGHIPSLEEGRSKLITLRESGPSQTVFNFAKPFPPPAAGAL